MKQKVYRKDNHYLRIDGEEATITEWAEESKKWGVSRQLIQDRLKRWLGALKKRKKEMTPEEYEEQVALITEKAVNDSPRRYRKREVKKPLETQQIDCLRAETITPPTGGA